MTPDKLGKIADKAKEYNKMERARPDQPLTIVPSVSADAILPLPWPVKP